MKTIRLDDPCGNCLLDCNPVRAAGERNAPYLVVAPPITEGMARKGQNLKPGAMSLFVDSIKKAGLNINHFYITNPIKCAYDKTQWKAKDRHDIEACCREYLLRLIEHVRPEIIIPMGAEAAKAVYGRGVKINKIRGVAEYVEDLGSTVFPMMDPSYVHVYPQHRPLFATDCITLARTIDFDCDIEAAGEDVLGDYRIVDDLQFLIDDDPEELSFDVECKGLRWFDPACELLTMQFCPEPGIAYMVVWDHPEAPASRRQKHKLKRQIKRLLQDPERSIIGQNLKFDHMWVWRELGFRFRIDHCTLMLAAELDENMQNKDLDTLTKIYAPEMGGYADYFNSKYDKSRMDLIPLKDLCPYGCGDSDAAIRVYNRLADLVYEDERLWNHYRTVAMPGINAFTSVERNGMLINGNALKTLQKDLEEYHENLRIKLLKQVDRRVKRKHKDKGVSFSRSAFIVDVLFKHANGFRLKPMLYTKSTKNLPNPEDRVPSTSSKDHLPYFFESCPFTIELAEYLKLSKLITTYVKGFEDKYAINSYIHPTYMLWGTVTGRSSSRDPNGQNFPNRGKFAKQYKRMFEAPPGYVIIGADLSQAELRIAACMSCDREMLRIYNMGGDIHSATAATTMGKSYEEVIAAKSEGSDILLMDVARDWPGADAYLRDVGEEKADTTTLKDFIGFKRFQAKAINFGFLYGMWWRSFIVYAKTDYGIEFTEEEAEEIRTAFFAKYKQLEGWHDAMKEFAREHKYVRSYSGKVRHLPMIDSDKDSIASEAERQAVNSPVQNFGSDLGIVAMSDIDREVNPKYMRLIGFVHDALYAIVPEEYVEWGAKTMKHYMENVAIEELFGVKLKLPIVSDVEFGWNAADTYEMIGLDQDKPYDFESIAWDSIKGEWMFELPEQKVPPMNGRKEHIEEWLHFTI